MRTLSLLTLLTTALCASAEPPVPVVELRARSLDGVLALSGYAAGLADKPELGQQVVALADAFTKEKTGLEGVDRARPIGAYVVQTASDQPAVVALIPIKDQKAFVNLLKTRLKFKVADSETGVMVNVPGVPVPLFVAFDAGYAYVAPLSADWVAAENRVDPKAFFATKLAPESVVNLVVRLDRVGADSKAAVVAQAELKNADDAKAGAKPGETPGGTAARLFAARKVVSAVAAVVKEGKSLEADFAIDPKADTISLAARVVPVTGSPMATYVKGLGERKGRTVAALSTDAGSGRVNFAFPESVRKEWAKLADTLAQEALDAPGDAGELPLRTALVDALRPTFEAGVFDAAFAFGGPEARRAAGVVGLVEGKELEKAARQILPLMPAKDGTAKLDLAEVGGAKLHLLTFTDPDADLGSGGKYWLATASDRLAVVSGKTQEGAAEAATRDAEPGPVLEARISPTAVLAFPGTKDVDAAKAATEKVYGDKPVAGRDEVKLRLTGGDSLDLAISVRGKAIAFAVAFDQATKEK